MAQPALTTQQQLNTIQETWQKDEHYFINDRVIRYDTNDRAKIINTFKEFADFISIVDNPYDKTEEDLYELELIIHTQQKRFISQNGFPQILRDEAKLDQSTRQEICYNVVGVKKIGGYHMKFGKIIWQFAINKEDEDKLIRLIQLVNQYIIRNRPLQIFLATGQKQRKAKMHWGTYDHKKYPYQYILTGLDLGFSSTDIKNIKSLKLITKTLLKNIPNITATDITWRGQFNPSTNRFNTREIRLFSLIKFNLIPDGERKIQLPRWWIEGVQIKYNMVLKGIGFIKTEPDKNALYNNDYIKTKFESDLEANILFSLYNRINNIAYEYNVHTVPIYEVQYELEKMDTGIQVDELIKYAHNKQNNAWSVSEDKIQFDVVIRRLNIDKTNAVNEPDVLMQQNHIPQQSNNTPTTARRHINQTLHRINTITGASDNNNPKHRHK